RVLTRPGAALPVRGEPKPGADHGLQPQNARVPRWIWIMGLGSGTIRYAAPPVRRFERQSVHGGSDPAQARKQARPEVHLHGFCTNTEGDQEQIAPGAALPLRLTWQSSPWNSPAVQKHWHSSGCLGAQWRQAPRYSN